MDRQQRLAREDATRLLNLTTSLETQLKCIDLGKNKPDFLQSIANVQKQLLKVSESVENCDYFVFPTFTEKCHLTPAKMFAIPLHLDDTDLPSTIQEGRDATARLIENDPRHAEMEATEPMDEFIGELESYNGVVKGCLEASRMALKRLGRRTGGRTQEYYAAQRTLSEPLRTTLAPLAALAI